MFGIIMPKTIKAKRDYTIEEIFETLKNEGGLPEPYLHTQKIGGANNIFFPGDHAENDIMVSVYKGKITVQEITRPGDFGKSVLKDAVGVISPTFAVGRHYADQKGGNKGNKAIFKAVLDACTRLFC